MAYTHNGTRPVSMKDDPIDADSTDWVFFSYADWLRDGETIVDHETLIAGGVIVTDATSLGTVVDDAGTEYANTYGVQFSVIAGSASVSITHRVTTTTTGTPNLARIAIDKTVVIPVKVL